MSVTPVLERLRAALEAAGVPYMVTGSFASSAHGVPRATNDIDIVIAPTPAELQVLLQQFPDSQYYASPEEAALALRHRSQFNVIDFDGMWKVDFIVRKQRPFSVREFSRRSPVEIAGVLVQTASPEDMVIAKLEWSRLSESERQISDAAGILRVQGETLDIDYIERWIAALELEPEWDRARRVAGWDV